MKAKILIFTYLIIIGVILYLTYPIVKNRYFTSDEKSDSLDSSLENKKESNNSPNTESTDENPENIPDESTVPDDIFIDVDQEDCEDNCEQFEDAEEKKYCQEYCGTTEDVTTADDCEKLTELEKDYCYKNKAIAKKDFSLCKKISDKKLSESCKNQLTESLLNGNGVTE